MTKRNDKTSPTQPTKVDEALVNTNSTRNQKKVVYEIRYEMYLGEMIPYILHETGKRYPVNAIGRLFGYGPKDEFKLYRANEPFLARFTISATVSGKRKSTSVPCIDSQGLLIMTGKAPLENLSTERQETVIKIVQLMAESTDMRLKGDLIPRSEVELLFDTTSLKDDPKKIQRHNSFRRAVFIDKVREAHPDNPNTFKRLHDLAHNDQALILGPDDPFESGKHRKYSKELAIKDDAQKMASFAAIASGNIEIDAINRFERNLFRGLPEKYVPDYLNAMIETTKQTQLLVGDGVACQ